MKYLLNKELFFDLDENKGLRQLTAGKFSVDLP